MHWLLILGLIGGALLVLRPQQHPTTPSPAPTSPEEAALRSQVSAAVQMLLQTNTDPATLELVANQIEPYGLFPSEVQALRTRAATLRAGR